LYPLSQHQSSLARQASNSKATNRTSRFLWLLVPPLLFAGCDIRGPSLWREESTRLGPRVVQPGQPVPKGGGRYKVGEPYRVNGRLYVPSDVGHYDRVGVASWYGELFHGRRTANGEIYDMEALTAAHPTLPIPSYAKVTNLENGRSLIVRVNDRGPYASNRIIDLSWAVASLLHIERPGTGRVRVQYVGEAPLSGDDSYERRILAAQRWAGPRVAFARSPAKAIRRHQIHPSQYSEGPTPARATRLAHSGQQGRESASTPPAFATASEAQSRRSPRTASNPSASGQQWPAQITTTDPAPFAHPTPAGPDHLPNRVTPGRDKAAFPQTGPAAPALRTAEQARTTAANGGEQPHSAPISPFRTSVDRAEPAPRMARRSKPSASAPYLGAQAAPPKSAYFVEAGIFPERPIAERLAAVLKDIAPASIEPIRIGNRSAHRIRIGPFPADDAAKAAAARMRAAGLTSARVEDPAGG
jgi:rare lipoprotein A